MDSGILVIFVSVIVVGVVLLVVMAATRRVPSSINKEEYQQKWLSIEQSLTNDPSSLQLAVLNADKLVDAALKARGHRGDTMGERMKSAKNVFSDRNGIWYAHKLRNQIAHEQSVNLSVGQTKKALQAFKRALKDLRAI
jgi:hypothetical protein